jgi:hypothetical protein
VPSSPMSLIQRRQVETRAGVSDPACAQLVQYPTIPLRRPTRTAIAGRHRNRLCGRGFGRSIEEARRCVSRTHPLLDHPHHLDYPRGLTNPCAHLVAR